MSNNSILPDGSAFFTLSLPLPKDHWLYDESSNTPIASLDACHRHSVIEAVKYAIRSATRNGTEVDFDPDALVNSACYALIGPFGDCIAVP